MLSNDLELESKNLRLSLSELHLKHKSLASEFRIQRDLDAKNKAELKRLKGKFCLLILSNESYPHILRYTMWLVSDLLDVQNRNMLKSI
jgi:E3 ubiquitin-protein ligase BRE1